MWDLRLQRRGRIGVFDRKDDALKLPCEHWACLLLPTCEACVLRDDVGIDDLGWLERSEVGESRERIARA